MKVLLISLNFYPEDTAIGHYSTETALYLKSQGCEVTVIAGFPYYPQWKIWENYQKKGFYNSENYQGIRIFRFKQYVPKEPNFVRRLIHISSFTFGNILNMFRSGRQDVVIAVVPFLTSIFLAKIHNLFYGSKTWTHVQDFEIEALKNSGMAKRGKWQINLLDKIESQLLLKSHRVSTISPQMINKLRDKNIANSYYFPNFIDTKDFQKSVDEIHPYCEMDKYNILYSGNIGEKQDWDLFVELVQKLKDDKKVKFVVVGDGSKKKWLSKTLKGVSNAVFYDPIPMDYLPSLLNSADLHLLFQKKSIINSVMPSKILGMLGSNKPVLICAAEASGLCELINISNGGYCFSDYRVETVLSVVETLIKEKLDGKTFQSNGFMYVDNNFSRINVLKEFYLELTETLN
ncbi:WcaI family glycosyltransferase [Aegicerativicinus sediminis]|uniref:WcaI family glycosyltransferase n=1 Tax=Aegicerativicinus sediminis TaxID=2893202 RepID=UPI001E5C815B|nr:WcaI family glycosyltransferase [Aegicerativicinus sediminis]